MKPATQTPAQFRAMLNGMDEEQILELQTRLEFEATQVQSRGNAAQINTRTAQLVAIDKHIRNSIFNH